MKQPSRIGGEKWAREGTGTLLKDHLQLKS